MWLATIHDEFTRPMIGPEVFVLLLMRSMIGSEVFYCYLWTAPQHSGFAIDRFHPRDHYLFGRHIGAHEMTDIVFQCMSEIWFCV